MESGAGKKTSGATEKKERERDTETQREFAEVRRGAAAKDRNAEEVS